MPTPEAQLRRVLREYAIQVRRLAYALPNGLGEHDLLELSDQMRAAADHAGQGMTATRDKAAEPADHNSAPSPLATGTESVSR